MPGPRSHLEAHYGLVARLLRGEVLDRDAIAKILEVELAAADRHIRALRAAIPQLSEARGPGRRRTLRLPAESIQPEPTIAMAVAACFGAALGRVFRESDYGEALRRTREHVLLRVRRKSDFKDSDRKFLFVSQSGEAALPKGQSDLDEIVEGILRHRVVKLRYTHFEGRDVRRTIEPLSLAIYQHQLYVIAREKGNIAVLRFARIRDADATAEQFRYPMVAEYDPVALFRSALGIFIRGEHPIADVVFRLSKSWKQYALSHRWHESQQVTVEHDGNVRVTMQVRMCPELEQLMLSFGEDADVLEPASLRDKIAARVRKMSAKQPK